MSESANVTSIEAIKDFRASLCRFGEDVRNALGEVEMEIRRALDWILHQQPAFWQMQIKRRKEDLSQAQAELFRRRLQAGPGREVHDTEQKEAVRAAQRRLLEAEQKLETVKKWGPAFQHAVSEYQARARPTGDMLGSELQKALALLDRMTGALDAYVNMAPPSISNADAVTSAAVAGTASANTASPLSSASRGVEPAPAPAQEAAAVSAVNDERSDERKQGDPVPSS
jgi:hypothetical protein